MERRTRVSLSTQRVWLTIVLMAAASGGAGAAEWRQYADPSRAGWSGPGLERARETAEEAGSAAVMVVENGIAVAAWGPADRPFPVHSVRKGLYNALVGMLVEEGELALDTTLVGLGIEEIDALTGTERSATVEDLLASRSGVYHESAYEPASMKRSRPERGSRRPGEHWFYNNWDFNLVAQLVERASGRELAGLFRDRLAAPLGMEDFQPDDVFSFLEPSRSRFPAVLFRMSARDLARFGELYRRKGLWEGERLLDREWIEATWKPRTVFPEGSPFGAGNGFGYLWWIYPARPKGEGAFVRQDVYLTRGSGGQVLAVLPDLGLVMVHLTVAEDAGFEDAVRVFDEVLAARGEAPEGPEPETVALRAEPLGEAPPLPERRTAVTWAAERIAELTGEYSLGPRVSFQVHEVDGRLFALPEGAPLAEVELFVDETGTIFSPAVDLALSPVREEGGEIVALEGRVDGRPARLERAEDQPPSR